MKSKNIKCILLIALAAISASVFFPVKIARKIEDIDTSKNYIIVNVQKSTISEWISISDNRGDYAVAKNVRLTGCIPGGYNYDVETGKNAFVCYGELTGVGELGGEHYDVFNVVKWDILYPINRNSPFDCILPKNYLCLFETIG